MVPSGEWSGRAERTFGPRRLRRQSHPARIATQGGIQRAMLVPNSRNTGNGAATTKKAYYPPGTGRAAVSEEQTRRGCDFFISYTGVDAAWAEWIAWQLKTAGYKVTIQAWHFRPGMNFVALMRQALDSCQRTLAVVSKTYLDQSTYGSDEWTAAFTHDDPSQSSLLLVLVERITLPRLLRPWVHIDLTNLAPDEATSRLLEGVQPGPVEPTEAPAFPGQFRPGPSEGPRYPGRIPEVSNLPARNVAFAGRDLLLDQLRQRLRQQGSAVLTAQALYGLGGVGKTQLALEYAHRYQADYDLIWWIMAEAPGAISAGLAELGVRLGLVQDTRQVADQEQLATAVLKELRRRERWLLVFDNVPDRQQLGPYLPQGNGQMLVTSRHPVWGGIALPVKVDTFSRAESIAFLTYRISDHDEATAGALAEDLGDLPLALEQAAAYMEQTGMPMLEYRALFHRQREKLLKRGEPTAYQGTVDTTWQLAIERIANMPSGGPAGVTLLRLCAFLAPEAIPLDLLAQHPDLLPEELASVARDELALQDAVAAVYQYSLLDRDQGGLRMHRLVQTVVRAKLAEQARLTVLTSIIEVLNVVFVEDKLRDHKEWPHLAQLIPHVLAAADHAEALRIMPASTADLLRRTGSYYRRRGEMLLARGLLERALTLAEASSAPDHPVVSSILHDLGATLRYIGDLGGARAANERALAIVEAARGPEDPSVASIVNNLALVLKEQGDLDGARGAFDRAVTIYEASLGSDHPYLGVALNQLGSVLREQKDLAGARAAHERALAIAEANLSPDHPDVGSALNNLALVLYVQGDLASARATTERALTITEEVLGPNHPEVAVALFNLGRILHDQGNIAGARAAYERALAIIGIAYGSGHPFAQAIQRRLQTS
jgi:tetratricopeptide (TPR) repeat protein